VKICLLAILQSISCTLPLNHPLGLLVEGRSGHFITLDCDLHRSKLMDLLRSLCFALCCTFKCYWN